MLVIWPEKVESDCSIDCSSPMSAYMAVKQGSSERIEPGMSRPLCAITASSPTVLSVTGLTARIGAGDDHRNVPGSGSMLVGTTVSGSSSGAARSKSGLPLSHSTTVVFADCW